MNTGYTHRINFFKNIQGVGWVEQSLRTTKDALQIHLPKLQNRKDIRCIDVVVIK